MFISKSQLLDNGIIKKLIATDHRSKKNNVNILFSGLYKALNLIGTFLLIRFTYKYLSPEKYGVWITVNSIIGWFSLMDIGLGNGLRNQLSIALTEKNYDKSKSLISTTYFIISIIAFALIVLFYVINPFINWNSILNEKTIPSHQLNQFVYIVFFFFSLRLVSSVIISVFFSFQNSSKVSLIECLNVFISIFFIAIGANFIRNSLYYVAFIYGFISFFLYAGYSVYFFRVKQKLITPSIKTVEKKYVKSLFTMGAKFFFLQVTSIILFSTDNIIIAKSIGVQHTAAYNIAFKYFSVSSIVFSVILTPFWSSFTEAFASNDKTWINNNLRKLILFWSLLVACIGIQLICANWVYKIWLGDSMHISLGLNIAVAVFNVVLLWTNIFAVFVNGIGKVNLQLYLGVLAAIVNIPLSIFFIRLWGVQGTLYATSLSLLPLALFMPLQSFSIIKKIS